MTTPRQSRRAPTRRLRVGDRVRFTLGGQRIAGIIIEDRGPLAAGGRRLYVVRARIDPESDSVFELPADEVHAA